MPKKDKENSRYVLNTWHIFQYSQSEINQLQGCLDKNRNLNLEFNIPGNAGSDSAIETDKNRMVEQWADAIISNGIDRSRIICEKFVDSDLPMFRIVRQIL